MAVDMFLKLDGIKGESKDAKHKDEIQIDSINWGLTNTGTGGFGGGSGAGKVDVHNITVSKVFDKASCDLMLACCNGKHIPQGLITVRKAGQNPLEYIKITLHDILISGVGHTGSAGSELVSETVTLNFSKFKVEYQEQKPDGSGTPAGQMAWDIKANAKF